MSCPAISVNPLKRDAEEKARNRSVLCTVVDVIRFLAKQNISFRGADESACSRNRGNFLELVHYTAKYSVELRDWLQNHPRNVSWLSPQIQNELLHSLALETVAATVAECQGRLFSILCDEVSDRSNHELLSLVIRFVVDDGYIRERLVCLIEVNSTSAAALHDVTNSKRFLSQQSILLASVLTEQAICQGCKLALKRHAPEKQCLFTAGLMFLI